MACRPRASSAAEGARSGSISHCTRTPLTSAWCSEPIAGVVHPVEQPRPQLPAVLQALGHGGVYLGVALRHGEDVEGGEPHLAAGPERVDDPGPEPLETLQGALPRVRFADGP